MVAIIVISREMHARDSVSAPANHLTAHKRLYSEVDTSKHLEAPENFEQRPSSIGKLTGLGLFHRGSPSDTRYNVELGKLIEEILKNATANLILKIIRDTVVTSLVYVDWYLIEFGNRPFKMVLITGRIGC